jgi:hypothetical protein
MNLSATGNATNPLTAKNPHVNLYARTLDVYNLLPEIL